LTTKMLISAMEHFKKHVNFEGVEMELYDSKYDGYCGCIGWLRCCNGKLKWLRDSQFTKKRLMLLRTR
jgi:translation elongation factor EF-4